MKFYSDMPIQDGQKANSAQKFTYAIITPMEILDSLDKPATHIALKEPMSCKLYLNQIFFGLCANIHHKILVELERRLTFGSSQLPFVRSISSTHLFL